MKIHRYKTRQLFLPDFTLNLFNFDDGIHIDQFDTKFFVKENQLHREDGPAVEYHNEIYNMWFLDGNFYHDINQWGRAVGIFDTDEFTMMKLTYA